MRTLSDAIGSSGAGVEYVTKEGKKIEVKPLNLRLMSKYEKWLESRAMAMAMELKDVDKELFREAWKQCTEDCLRGAYCFGGDVCSESLSTSQGIAKLVGIMTNLDDEEALQLVMGEGDKFKEVLDLCVKQSLPVEEEGEKN